MKNIFSITIFALLFLGLGALALSAAPGGLDVMPGSAPAESVVQDAASAPTAAKYNMIALPLDSQAQFTTFDAAGMAAFVGPSVQQVLEWNAVSGVFDGYIPIIGGPTNFPLTVGGTYFLLVDGTAPTVLSFVGDVPDQGTVTNDLVGGSPACKYNSIIVPLDQTIADAVGLVASLGGDTVVQQALSWNATTQVFDGYIPVIGGPDNFTVKSGYPYMVCLTNSAAPEWP